MLQTLHDVGLDYIKLGQPSPTLSGGEAQRIKLARELCRRSDRARRSTCSTSRRPACTSTTSSKLLEVLHGFVDAGNTVLVIEHNLDVIKTADWVIDLGPEGGAGGGESSPPARPKQVAKCDESYTGQALKPVLDLVDKRPLDSRTAETQTTQAERPGHARSPSEGGVAAQPQERHVALPRDEMTRLLRAERLGQELAGDRHDLRRRPAALRRVAVELRPAVPRPVQKPKVEHVDGLSPAISIEQKTTSKSPRSTVGTVTEIYDYLRILYARLGQPYCPTARFPSARRRPTRSSTNSQSCRKGPSST